MTPLRIAVCDDNARECQILQSMLSQSAVSAACSLYSSGCSLLEAYYPGRFDLLLLDIYMEGINGVETAAEIRARDPQVCIAFLTSSPDFTMEGYRHHVDRYLLKPVRKEELDEVLRLADQRRAYQPGISLSVQGKPRIFPYSRICYAEQEGHALWIHLTDNEPVKITMRLAQLAQMLPSPPFYQFHKSFLVNLSHVSYLDSEIMAFMINGGGCAYIRRGSFREAQTVYSRFMFDQMKKQEDS